MPSTAWWVKGAWRRYTSPETSGTIAEWRSRCCVPISERWSASNGRLLAYTSNKSGLLEVYLTTIPGPGPHVQVSVDGGAEPAWSPDGNTLFFRGPTRMKAATFVERPTLAVTRRDTLFTDTYRRFTGHATYDVMPNGREFVMTRGAAERSTIYLVVNWKQLSRIRGAEVGER